MKTVGKPDTNIVPITCFHLIDTYQVTIGGGTGSEKFIYIRLPGDLLEAWQKYPDAQGNGFGLSNKAAYKLAMELLNRLEVR